MGTISTATAAAQAAAAQNTTASNSSVSTTSNGDLSLAGNFNTFLTLLTTQLQNQDPLDAVDSNQFTQQLVEFAGVQQQTQTNSLLQQLVSASQATQIGSASSFVGTTIQASGNQGALVNGSATFGYTLPSAASNVQVSVTDSSGNVVYTGTGTGNSGSNTVSWNGTNNLTGATEPAGTYTISVTATDANGNTITATPFETGTVTSASLSNGTLMLNIGSLAIPETSVTSVTNLSGASGSTSSLSSAMSSLSSEISSLTSELSSAL